MKNMKISVLAEAAVLSALSSLLVVISIYVPVLSLFTSFMCGFPIMIVFCRRGTPIGIASLVVSVLICLILVANPISVVFIGFMYLIPETTIGYMAYKNHKFFHYILVSGIFVLIGLVIQLFLLNGMGGGIEEQITASARESIENMKSMIPQGVGIDAAKINTAMNETIVQITDMTLIYIPSIAIIVSAVMGYVISVFGVFLLRRLKIKDVSYVKFNMIRASKATLVVFFISFLMEYILKDGNTVLYAFYNLQLLSMLMIVLSGFSCTDYLLGRKIKSGYIRAVIYAAVFLFGLMLMPILIDVFVFIGILEVVSRRRISNESGDDRSEQ